MRLTEAEYQTYLRRGQPAPMSEAAFQAAVIRILKQSGYPMIYHTHTSKRSPEGFPDLICAPDGGTKSRMPLLALELKTDTGQVTPAQVAWLNALDACNGIYAELLRPRDLEAFVARLREGP